MKVFYKIEGQTVERSIFKSMVGSQPTFNAWENVIEENKQEIEKRYASVVFKITDEKFHVLTETSLLFKLAYEVKKKLLSYQSRQKATQLI